MNEGQLDAQLSRPGSGGREYSQPRVGGARFGTARRNRYVAAVGAAAVVGLAAPVLVNAALQDQPPARYASSAEAFSNNLVSYEDWPLDFGALKNCTVPITEDALGVPEFTCDSARVEAIGMVGVKDQPRAVDRGIRAINFAELQSMRPVKYTDTALKIAPELRDRAGVTDVWASDYYEVSAANHQEQDVDPFQDAELSRTIGFYRAEDGEGPDDSPGTMVILQVTARGVDNTKAMVNELLNTAELGSTDEESSAPEQREGSR